MEKITCLMDCENCNQQTGRQNKMMCAVFMQNIFLKEIIENQDFMKKNIENMSFKMDEVFVKINEEKSGEETETFNPIFLTKTRIENEKIEPTEKPETAEISDLETEDPIGSSNQNGSETGEDFA